jgi:predicted ATPase
VIGREVPLTLLRAVWETPGSLDVHLLDLKRQEFLHERGASEEQVFVFKHALTQDVAYDSLLRPAKQALHEATARAIEVIYQDRLEEHYERLAHHYSRTTNNQKTLEYLELANRKAAKSNAMHQAKTYFDQAMALLDTMPDTQDNRRRRVSLIVDQWIVFWLLLIKGPEYHDLLVRYEETATSLDEPRLLARFQLNLGHCRWGLGHIDQTDTFMNVVRLNEAADAADECGPAYCMLQWTHLQLGNLEQALSWQGPALQSLRRRFDLR